VLLLHITDRIVSYRIVSVLKMQALKPLCPPLY